MVTTYGTKCKLWQAFHCSFPVTPISTLWGCWSTVNPVMCFSLLPVASHRPSHSQLGPEYGTNHGVDSSILGTHTHLKCDRVCSKWLVSLVVTHKSHGCQSPFSRFSHQTHDHHLPDVPNRSPLLRMLHVKFATSQLLRSGVCPV